MSDSKKPLVWLDRYPVLDADHIDDLETRAGVAEFKHKLPREQAEEKAHADYLVERARDAAAHHLVGVRAAHAAGDSDAAAEHGAAYAGAMKAAGHDAYGPPPPEVLDRVRAARPQVYKFKSHPADALFAPKQEEADPADARIAELLATLKAQRAQVAE
jgi:hypothetical protein